MLEIDSSDARAFCNWGKAVAVRAELAFESGDEEGGMKLLQNAIDKYEAALEVDANSAAALRQCGVAMAELARHVEAGSRARRRLLQVRALCMRLEPQSARQSCWPSVTDNPPFQPARMPCWMSSSC